MTEVKPVESGTSPGQAQQSEAVKEPQIDVQELNKKVEGLTQGIQAERERRQAAEQQARLMEQLLSQQQSQPAHEDFDPDDVATNAMVERLVNQRLAPLQQTQSAALRQQEIQLMKQKYPDFNKVVGIGSYFDEVQKDYPGLLERIESMPGGVEIAYRIGQTHPEYQKTLKEKATQEVIDKAEKNLSRAPSLSSGESVESNLPDYENMSQADLEKRLRKVKGF